MAWAVLSEEMNGTLQKRAHPQANVRQSLSTLPFARATGRTMPRPAGGWGRVAGTRASLLIAVSAFVLATVLATPGQANAQGTSQQTPQVLVSNFGQTAYSLGALVPGAAQGFRTGTNAAGYTLTSIKLLFNVGNPIVGENIITTVTLHSGSATGSTVADFPSLSSAQHAAGVAVYTLTPTTTVTLDSNTDYWVVASAAGLGAQWAVAYAGEDATPALGWSIHDRGQYNEGTGFEDALGDVAYQLSVYGTIIGGDSNGGDSNGGDSNGGDSNGGDSNGASSRSGQSNAPLKARFQDVPVGHDGSTAFTLLIAFNEPIKTTETVQQALTVTGGTVTSVREVGGFSDRWEIIVTPDGDDDVRISLPPTTSCNDEGAICSYDRKVLQRSVAISVPRAPLTARFESVPVGHDGSTAFALQLAFSEPIETTVAVLTQALTVTNGTVTSVQKVGGFSDRWEIIVTPDGDDDVRMSLPPPTSCDDDNAVCTAEGRMLLQGVAISVPRAPLTARFEEVPTGHHGSTAFALQLAFSEPIRMTASALRQALTVTGGRMIGPRRVGGRSDWWEIIIHPNATDVRIALPSTTSCDAKGAVCTQDGLALQNDMQAVIPFAGHLMPHSLAKISGDDQAGAASTQLAESLVVFVSDEDSTAMAGVVVTFTVTAGGGMLSANTDANPCTFESAKSSVTAITDANGQATTRLTLGSRVGTNTVEVTVAELEPETFTATTTEQVMPHSLATVCGEDQAGTAGERLAKPLVVLVSDEEGAAMTGVAVSFAVTAGGGTLSATTDTTNTDGLARTWLTLGSELGTNTVEATVAGLESVTFTATGQELALASFFDAFLGRGKLVGLPDSPQLAQNAPNPFNSQTVLAYFLHTPGPARLEVFSLTGQRVAVLHQGPQQTGYHRLRWDGRDDTGRLVASGMYLYRLITNEVMLTHKLMLLR